MAVVASRTVATCKICKSPHRQTVDALLERRSNREKGVNEEYVKAQMLELGFVNPTTENLKTHWRKHCEVISDQQEEERGRVLDEALRRFAEGERISDDELLELIKFCGYYDLAKRVEAGEMTGVTIDQALKAVAEKTKRRHNEEAANLMRGVGGAIAAAFGGPKPVAGATVLEIEPSDEAEDAEVVT